jgi:hypothetical protein
MGSLLCCWEYRWQVIEIDNMDVLKFADDVKYLRYYESEMLPEDQRKSMSGCNVTKTITSENVTQDSDKK